MRDKAMNLSTRLWTPTRVLSAVLFLTFSALAGTRSMAADANQQASNNLIHIVASPSSSYVTIQVTFPQTADLSTADIVLNGKEITARVSQVPCSQGRCMSGTVSEADGLHSGKNVVYATAKSDNGNGVMSGRTRFFSTEGMDQPSAVSRAMLRSAAQVNGVTASDSTGFPPPTVTFQTNYGGGYNGTPWIKIGSTSYPTTQLECTAYILLAFDRGTLQPISTTQGPCIASGSSLVDAFADLKQNHPGALVVAGTVSSYTADGALDTSLIGGNDHTKVTNDNPAVKMYLAIGVAGAAPGTAFENFTRQVDPPSIFFTPMYPYATGVVQEDANGNYNFESSDVLEYTIDGSPADTANGPTQVTISAFQATIQQTPGLKGYRFTPPSVNSARGGYWLLVVQRDSPWSPIKSTNPCNVGTSPGSDGMILISNCGDVYPTGDVSDSTGQTRANAYRNLATALNATGPYDLVFLSSWGDPACCINQWSVVGNGSNNSNGFFEFGDALQALGGSGRAALFANNYGNQGLAFVSSRYSGDTLVGNAAISSTTYSASGQAGYLHGTLARNLNGLFQPYQSSQQLSAADDQAAGQDYTLTRISTLQPVPWPSNETKLPTSDTMTGQQGAYAYISYTLITQYYIKGATGPYLDDIHYFFTGSNSNYINYHYFDAINLPWPGGGSTSYTWTDPVTQQSVTFSSADFKAVASQVSHEVVYLTNAVNFLLTGPVNMKDIMSSGSANAGLALTGAAANVLSSSLNNTVTSTTPVKVNVANIISLLSGVASILSSVEGYNVVEKGALKTANLWTGIIGGGLGGLGSGLQIKSGGNSTTTPPPSRYISFTTTIGQLANSNLQGQIGVSFDIEVDSILADWGKLSTLGPKIADTSNAGFYSPDQVARNIALQMLTNASERSFYMSLVPTLYNVDFWPQFYGSGSDDVNGTTTNPPDMGALNGYQEVTCHQFYTTPAPPYSYEWTPTPGGYALPVAPPKASNFWSNLATVSTPADYYVLRGAVDDRAGPSMNMPYMDANLSQQLFSPSGLNIPFDLFVTPYGPMSGHVHDMSEWNPDEKNDQVVNDITGYASNEIAPCSLVVTAPGGTSSADPSATTTILTVPASSVLGEPLTLTASVTATGNPVTTGSLVFLEGTTRVGTADLDATGTATTTLSAPALGQHSYQAYYARVAPYSPSSSNISTTTVFANSPELSLSLSVPSLDVSYGETSKAVAVQIMSKYGATGPVVFSCSGLPIGMSCSFSPAQTSLSSGATATTNLTIRSSTATTSNRAATGFSLAVFLPLSLLPLLEGLGRRRRMGQILCLGMVAVAIGSLAGCSGSGSSSSNPIQETGAKTVLITASSGSISTSMPLVVNIQ